MDKLLACVTAFEKLLEVQYRIIIGRKGKSVELRIEFSTLDFHHLMGLGKLKDLRVAKQNRDVVFHEILSDKVTYATISASRYISTIESRFEPFQQLERLLDDNRLLFRYNGRLNPSSLIEADYLLSTPFNETDVYLFVSKNAKKESYFCRSFFPKDTRDFTKGQAAYTMLYKEKIHLPTGMRQVQFDRLTPKPKPDSPRP